MTAHVLLTALAVAPGCGGGSSSAISEPAASTEAPATTARKTPESSELQAVASEPEVAEPSESDDVEIGEAALLERCAMLLDAARARPDDEREAACESLSDCPEPLDRQLCVQCAQEDELACNYQLALRYALHAAAAPLTGLPRPPAGGRARIRWRRARDSSARR